MAVLNWYIVEGVGERDSASSKVRAFSAADALAQCQTHWNNCWPRLTAVSVQPFVESADQVHLRTCGTEFCGCDPACPKQLAQLFTGGCVRHKQRGDLYVLLCRVRSGWLAVRHDDAHVVLDASDGAGQAVDIYYFPETDLAPR